MSYCQIAYKRMAVGEGAGGVDDGGWIGRYLSMDLMNEMLNWLFKDQLEGAKRCYAEETI